MSRKQRSHGQGTLFKRKDRGPWIASWYGHDGRRRERSTRTTDRAAAERILAKRVADAALRRDGVIDARTDRFSEAERRPLGEHVTDWLAALQAKNVTTKQVNALKKRAETLLRDAGVERLSDLSPSSIQTTIGELHGSGTSLQTCHHYLRALKQFSRWLKRDGRTREDALTHLNGYNAATDRRYERRALDSTELSLLIEATQHAPV